MNEINTIIREYFKKNKIKLKEVARLLNTSQSNLSERLNSKRSITLDEFFILYTQFGDNFAITVMEHYGSRMLFLERIKDLIAIADQLKTIYNEVREKNEQVFGILDDIEKGINVFSSNQ